MQLEISFPDAKIINWHNHFGDLFWQFLLKLTSISIPRTPAALTHMYIKILY